MILYIKTTQSPKPHLNYNTQRLAKTSDKSDHVEPLTIPRRSIPAALLAVALDAVEGDVVVGCTVVEDANVPDVAVGFAVLEPPCADPAADENCTPALEHSLFEKSVTSVGVVRQPIIP